MAGKRDGKRHGWGHISGDCLDGIVSTKLFVGGLPLGSSQSELRALFSRYGKVAECDIIKDFAFVHYDDPNEARAAVAALDNSDFHGVNIKVQVSHSRVRQKPGMGDEGKCYRCGAVGHWTKECPLQARERYRQAPSSSSRRPAGDRGGLVYGDSQMLSYPEYQHAVRTQHVPDWASQYGTQTQSSVSVSAGQYIDRYHPYAVRLEQRRIDQVAPVAPAVSTYTLVDEFGRPTPEYYASQQYYSALAEPRYAMAHGMSATRY